MGIGQLNYSQYCSGVNSRYIGYSNPSRTKIAVGLNSSGQDTFVKTSGVNSSEPPASCAVINELNRLFPNGEIYKIYDDIVKEYGLETPPEFKLEADSKGNTDYASTSHISNSVTLNLDNMLAPDMYKFLTEKNGQKSYCYDDDLKRIKVIKTSDRADLDAIIAYNKQLGADNCTAVPLTDDDKRKLIISSLAHELEHCYQNQIIRQTEGLDEFDMITTQIKNNPDNRRMNLIEQTLMFYKIKDKYNSHHPQSSVEKLYSQDSTQGRKAVEWYNATVNYTDFNSDYASYKNNPLELDANEKANRYLIEHYGDFETP